MSNLFGNINKNGKIRVTSILDAAGLCLIGIFCLAYAVFVRRFAEVHIQFSFLDFPIFVGEILLFICLILLIIRWKLNPPGFKIWHYCLSLYLLFILTKAFWGYFEWGPLAFRHAALFYYPLFAVCGYSFYRKSLFKSKGSMVLVLLIIFIIRLPQFNDLFLLTCFILSFVIIKAYPHKVARYILFILLLIVMPYKKVFFNSRTMVVGNIISGLYLVILLPFVLKIKKSYKIIFSLMIALFLLTGLLIQSDNKNLTSLVNFGVLIKQYNAYDEIIARGVVDPGMREIIEEVDKKEVKLYNPESGMSEELDNISDFHGARLSVQESTPESPRTKKQQMEGLLQEIERDQRVIEEIKEEREETELTSKAAQSKIAELQTVLKQTRKRIDEAEKERARVSRLQDRMPNVFFRLFIWRDMLNELKEKKAFLGFDFGKPFRSRSIETLYWSTGEWARDGWIASHNSYLETIYRAGIMGLLFVALIFAVLFKLIKRSMQLKSVAGILLCGVLINWLVVSNFLPILELPYNAIAFWSLFGMTLAHMGFKKEFVKK